MFVRDSGDSTRTAFRVRMDDLLKCVVRMRCLIRVAAMSVGNTLISAPSNLAFVMTMESSPSPTSASMRPRIEFLDVSLIFEPALLTTS